MKPQKMDKEYVNDAKVAKKKIWPHFLKAIIFYYIMIGSGEYKSS